MFFFLGGGGGCVYMLSLGIFILRFVEAITLQLTLNEAVGQKCKVLQVKGDNFHKVLLLYLQRKYNLFQHSQFF